VSQNGDDKLFATCACGRRYMRGSVCANKSHVKQPARDRNAMLHPIIASALSPYFGNSIDVCASANNTRGRHE